MLRLSELDVPARLSPVMPGWMAEGLTAVAVLLAAGLARLGLDALIPNLAPFALLFPAGLTAALLAGWRAGAAAFYGGYLFSWYYIVPPRGFAVSDPGIAGNMVVVAVSGALTLVIAETFRDSAKQAAAERATKLAERDLLLSEMNHRMKNNFQMVASLLHLQRNRAKTAAEKAALGEALNRVMGIAQAHRNLYAVSADVSAVDVGAYLADLCAHLAEALFGGRLIRLECRTEPVFLGRDRAVALGLIVNELVTNAAKHAFDEGIGGLIEVELIALPDGCRLIVRDDGKGLPEDYARSSRGLGRGLVDGFARQAGGALAVGPGPGAVFVLELGAAQE